MKTKFLVKEEIENKKKKLVTVIRAWEGMLVISGSMLTTFSFLAARALQAGSMILAVGFLICVAAAIACAVAQFMESERMIEGCLDYIWHYCDIAFESLRLKKELTIDEIIDESKHIPRVD